MTLDLLDLSFIKKKNPNLFSFFLSELMCNYLILTTYLYIFEVVFLKL